MKKDHLLAEIAELKAEKTLFIVSCTLEKIWDEANNILQYVEAKKAYKGEEFIEFLNFYEVHDFNEKGIRCILISGKYGFIEAEHPISWYDINMSNLEHFPISKKSLNNQVNQFKRWRVKNGNVIEVRLVDFDNLICVNCDSFYIKRIKESFGNKNYIIIEDIRNID